jgi:hypothetical protein
MVPQQTNTEEDSFQLADPVMRNVYRWVPTIYTQYWDLFKAVFRIRIQTVDPYPTFTQKEKNLCLKSSLEAFRV